MMSHRILSSGLAVAFTVSLGTLSAPVYAQYFDQPSVMFGGQSWTNYLRLDDLDGDGDLDVTIPNCAGFFSPPNAQQFLVLANDGSANFADMASATAGAALGISGNMPVRVAATADIDADGDLDMFLPSAGGTADRLYVFDAGAFVDEASTRLPGGGTQSNSAGARFGDVDNDGDVDLLVAQGYASSDSPPARLYLNDGNGVFVESMTLPGNISGQDPDDIDFADFDRDFDLDVLVNTHAGAAGLWINDGNGTFSDASANLPGPTGGPFSYGPSACDVDGDGDLDIWRDNMAASPRAEQLFINDGDGNFTDETNARVNGNPGDADDNGVWCVDIDLDGDFDAVVASLSNNERVLINDGSGNFTLQSGGFPSLVDATLWMDWGDVNGDGRIDVVTGQGEIGNTVNRLYLANNTMPVDTRAPDITHAEAVPASVAADSELVMRFAVSDQVVTDSGPRLDRAFARVVIDGGAPQEVEATFMGGDLFRVVLPTSGGADVQVTPCAVDRQGNEGCGEAQSYSLDGSAGVGGGAGAGGGGATGGGSNGSGGGFDVDDDGGCGCRVIGNDSRGGSAAWLLALGLGGMALRRSRRRRS